MRKNIGKAIRNGVVISALALATLGGAVGCGPDVYFKGDIDGVEIKDYDKYFWHGTWAHIIETKTEDERVRYFDWDRNGTLDSIVVDGRNIENTRRDKHLFLVYEDKYLILIDTIKDYELQQARGEGGV